MSDRGRRSVRTKKMVDRLSGMASARGPYSLLIAPKLLYGCLVYAHLLCSANTCASRPVCRRPPPEGPHVLRSDCPRQAPSGVRRLYIGVWPETEPR